MSEQAIVLNELTKHYGKHRGINNLSFSVNQGEFFGFIGPNGAGKSTTIRTLMGLIRPTGGSASIFGLDCHSKASVIAKDVGYLPSENSYYENMKVRELLQYTADLYGMDCKAKMKELADRLNLDLSRKIADLSLGNKKKVGIVSAIMTSYGRTHQRVRPTDPAGFLRYSEGGKQPGRYRVFFLPCAE